MFHKTVSNNIRTSKKLPEQCKTYWYWYNLDNGLWNFPNRIRHLLLLIGCHTVQNSTVKLYYDAKIRKTQHKMNISIITHIKFIVRDFCHPIVCAQDRLRALDNTSLLLIIYNVAEDSTWMNMYFTKTLESGLWVSSSLHIKSRQKSAINLNRSSTVKRTMASGGPSVCCHFVIVIGIEYFTTHKCSKI